MATVYRGKHTTLDRDVAIKVLHPHLSSSSRNRKRFAREARAIEQLHHQNILEIFDYSGIESDECYIITEFVDGFTLTALVEERGRLPSEVVSIIGLRLCAALQYAHNAGILHRDLKPENVMVRVDGTVKLMDFGIARFLNESQVTLTGALVGSPAFMSPEQALESDLDLRSDLFSLGTVLFYLSTGCLPFTGTNPSLILKKVIEGDRPNVLELAPDLSASLADVIERLMATTPNERFNTAADAGEALRHTLDEVYIDPADDGWSLRRYLEDTDAFDARLMDYIRAVLLEEGKFKLQHGESIRALRLFNRLLSLGGDNEEVLDLVQGLHADPISSRRRAPLAVLTLIAGAILVIGILFMATRAASPPPSPVQSTQIPEQIEDAEPEAAPLPLKPLGPEPPPILKPPLKNVRPSSQIRPPSPAPKKPREAPPPDPEPPGPASLTIRSNIPAEVFHQGQRIGSTRVPMVLAPGSYMLELRGDVILPRQFRVEVGPGEALSKEVTVEARPATVRISRRFDWDCSAILDGKRLGSLRSLRFAVQVPQPDHVGHFLIIQCDGHEDVRKEWNSFVPPGFLVGPE